MPALLASARRWGYLTVLLRKGNRSMRRLAVATVLLALIGIPTLDLQAQTFGSWTTITNNREYLTALTQNDSGNVLGQWCYPSNGSCIWILALKTQCEKGSEYPVLVNSENWGSASLQVYCDGPLSNMPGPSLYRYVFTNFDGITNPVMKSPRIGFAFPLQGDQFTVVRFDLAGAPSALRAMRAAAANRVQPGRRGTLDEKL